MRFSIITSIYNQKHLMPKYIEAFENQTFKDFEVHFCDDGSTDGLKEWLEENPPKFPWHYHRNRPVPKMFKKMKLTKVVNRGIKHASGEYCVFIMGDSFPELNYLEVLDNEVDEDSIICGIRIQIDNNKGVDMDWRLKKHKILDIKILLPDKPWGDITGNGLTIPTRAFRECGGWNEKIMGYGGDDNEIVARLYFNGYLVWSVPYLIIYHNWHKQVGENTKKSEMVKKLIKSYYVKRPQDICI
jgi:GT2 family glycosyltransferase